MSDLRKHLQALREQHRSQRYPGDLAAEMLRPPMRLPVTKLLFVAAAGIGGIAAAIALWMVLRPVISPTPHPGGKVVIATPATTAPAGATDIVTPVSELAALPTFPSDVPIAPTAESSDLMMAPSFGESIDIGSIPSIPAMDMSFSDETSPSDRQTSKEST
jgi:hypothetical protein